MGQAREYRRFIPVLLLTTVFGGYEDETDADRQEAVNSQGRKKQQPQVSLDSSLSRCLILTPVIRR